MARSDEGGVEIAPRWRIVSARSADESDGVRLVIDPGPGFGDGTHETTQLCLQAVAAIAPRAGPWRMLDCTACSGRSHRRTGVSLPDPGRDTALHSR